MAELSIRQHYAGQALAALLAYRGINLSLTADNEISAARAQGLAKAAFAIAEAMVEADQTFDSTFYKKGDLAM